jgi:hypothetical protein
MPVPDHQHVEVIAAVRHTSKAPSNPQVPPRHNTAPVDLDRFAAVLAKGAHHG